MKKNAIIITSGAAAVFVLAKAGVFNALLLFVLVGAIPGTDYSIPSSFMLLASLTAMWFLLFRWAALKTLHHRAVKKLQTSRAAHKKQLPKRRFNQL